MYFFTDPSKLSQVVAELARRVDAIAIAQFNDAMLCDVILCVKYVTCKCTCKTESYCITPEV